MIVVLLNGVHGARAAHVSAVGEPIVLSRGLQVTVLAVLSATLRRSVFASPPLPPRLLGRWRSSRGE